MINDGKQVILTLVLKPNLAEHGGEIHKFLLSTA